MPKTKKLNMEEKHQLQKLINADIDAAQENYRASRSHARGVLEEHLIENTSPEVRASFDAYKTAQAQNEKAEQELDALGYDIWEYGVDAPKLRITSGKGPLELAAFDAETSTGQKKFPELKRDFTLRLFAGGEEAKELFDTLTKELANIAE